MNPCATGQILLLTVEKLTEVLGKMKSTGAEEIANVGDLAGLPANFQHTKNGWYRLGQTDIVQVGRLLTFRTSCLELIFAAAGRLGFFRQDFGTSLKENRESAGEATGRG